MTMNDVVMTPERWQDRWEAFKNEPQQVTAIWQLYDAIKQSDPALLAENAEWATKFSEAPPKPAGPITPELMHHLTAYPASSFNEAFCTSFNNMLAATGFDQHPQAMQMLMANLMTESGNFIWMKEIASGDAYEGRHDLGNTQPGDGRRFKGCGPLQVTGRVHFQQFHDWLKANKGIDDPRILSEGTAYVADAYPFEIAISWIQGNRLLDVCLNDGFDACCRRINGGTNGWQSRHANYQHCQQVMA
jgi:predicted chitinase